MRPGGAGVNVLFVFFVPSGGVDTLNRNRCLGLRRFGIKADCLYYSWGAGIQNYGDIPVYISNDDNEIKKILEKGKYDFIVATTDHYCFERFRRLGYKGKFILEIQGYGSKEIAREQLRKASSTINTHAAALLNPNTPHITEIFNEVYPNIPKFSFNNCFDSTSFTHHVLEKPSSPILAWVGRLEDNKNWREFILIAYMLKKDHFPDLVLWMYEDANLAMPGERDALMNMVYSLNLHPSLHIFSNVPNMEMQYYYSMIGDSGGLVCLTSKVEGAPLSVLEAMSCLCPVMTSSSDGISSSVIHNVTGKVYPLGQISVAVQEASQLIGDHVYRNHIRVNGHQHVCHAFSIDRYCKQFIHMLNTL